jgi:mono/diheme cytochrome c family protein
MRMSNTSLWILWALLTLALCGWLGYSLLLSDDNEIFLLGQTSHGHHQIELACTSCHTSAFGGQEVLQDACMNCHGDALKAAQDDHPRSKFTDPRNADRLAEIDARYCIACHREHKPELTGEMGVTRPDDFCFHCHANIAETRPSHAGMEFNTCASAGCHNYHDNTALYEDFLLTHAGQPDLLEKMRVPVRGHHTDENHADALTLADIDMPATLSMDSDIPSQWQQSAHARSGVNCSDCHSNDAADSGVESQQPAWIEKPDHNSCRSCHEQQVSGFLSGMHGMRLAAGLTPMRPALSWKPMRAQAADITLSCNSCHQAHDYNPVRAATESCLGCHADNHSLAYQNSKHAALWQQEISGSADSGSGVSCATCHLPRETHQKNGKDVVRVQHNQNHNLRPVEKMARDVCMHCHGLGFTLDALADPALRANNFQGRPAAHIESIRMAEERLRQQQENRQNRGTGQ